MPKQKFTDLALRQLKSPSLTNQIDYWDQLTPGLGVRVGRGGRKAFFVYTRVDGRPRRFTLRPAFPQLSLAAARTQAEKIIKDAQIGLDPVAAKAAEIAEVKVRRRNTFAAVAAEFMLDHGHKLRTKGELQRKLDVDLLPHWGDRPIVSITRADITSLLRAKARQSPISSNRLAALISKIFTWAIDQQVIAANPATRLPRYGQETERERNLSLDEIKTLWAAFDQIGYPFGHVFKMLLLTGQRRGEVAGMQWSEIDGDGWTVPSSRAKTKAGHRVPLSTLALEIIADCPRLGEHVFIAHQDKPLQGWSKSKARVDDPVGVSDWRLHDLRRTMATHMRSLGIDRLVVSKILNHAEGGITRVYDRYAADPEQAAAMERWANRLRALVSGQVEENVVELRKARL